MTEVKAGGQPWLEHGTLLPYAGGLVFAQSKKSLGWQDRLAISKQKARLAGMLVAPAVYKGRKILE